MVKCRIEGCESSDMTWGVLGFHLRSAHGFNDEQMGEYADTHSRDLWEEAREEREK